MDEFENCMNPPEYTHSENPVIDAFAKDGKTDMNMDITNPDNQTETELKALTPRERSNETGKRNLIDQSKRTKEEQKRIASMGGKASQAKQRERKELKERCKILLEMMPNKALIAKSLGDDTELPEGADMYDLMIAKMMQVAALDGNVKAFEAVRDSAGDKPTEKVQQEVAVMTDKDKELMAIIEARMSSGDGQSKK